MVQGLADYAPIIQAWQHPTCLRLLYSERLDGARLLAIIKLCRLIARMPSLFVLQFASSSVNLILCIEIKKHE